MSSLEIPDDPVTLSTLAKSLVKFNLAWQVFTGTIGLPTAKFTLMPRTSNHSPLSLKKSKTRFALPAFPCICRNYLFTPLFLI